MVAPSRVRELKPNSCKDEDKDFIVAPSRVRELKPYNSAYYLCKIRRTLTGAWIETSILLSIDSEYSVAPSRVRELKHPRPSDLLLVLGRTLTGAWIETKYWEIKTSSFPVAPSRVRELKLPNYGHKNQKYRRTLTGAWIETFPTVQYLQSLGRTLTGAWIETEAVDSLRAVMKSHPHGCVNWNFLIFRYYFSYLVAPSRVRELKLWKIWNFAS